MFGALCSPASNRGGRMEKDALASEPSWRLCAPTVPCWPEVMNGPNAQHSNTLRPSRPVIAVMLSVVNDVANAEAARARVARTRMVSRWCGEVRGG